MNINRRNVGKSVSAISLVGLSGCVSALGNSEPAEIEGHSITKENESFIIEIETEDKSIQNINVSLYTTPYSNSNTLSYGDSTSKNIILSYKLTDFTEYSDNKYRKEISQSTVHQQLPVHETVSIRSLITINEEDTADLMDNSVISGMKRGEYYVTTFRDGTFIDQPMVRSNYPTYFGDSENAISKYEKWTDDDTIYINMNFYVSQKLLSTTRLMHYHEFNTDSDTILPFNITISIPKKEKQAVEEITENPYPDITWTDFNKTIDHPELGQHKYYERPIFKDIASQITNQFDKYKSDIPDVYTHADLRILRRLYRVFMSYDKNAIDSSYSTVVYPSQAFTRRKTDCEGTTFTTAGVAYQLGYDVSVQGLTRENESYIFHVQPAAKIDTEEITSMAKSKSSIYRFPSEKRNSASKESMTHLNIHPRQLIGFSPEQYEYYNDDAPKNTLSVVSSLEH